MMAEIIKNNQQIIIDYARLVRLEKATPLQPSENI
jgi:hypothetical protein